MMRNDFTNKAVLITGGTKGIGLATGLAFGRHGAHVYLTNKWGSADENRVREEFAGVGAPEPVIVEADVGVDEDTVKVLEAIKKDHDGIEVFLSNVCVVQMTKGIDSLSRRALLKSLELSSWPLVAYIQKMKEIFGRYPRYVIGSSSDGVDNFYPGYDFVAAAKMVMETFCRYLAKRLAKEGVCVNMVRTRNVITDSALDIYGAEYPEFFRKYSGGEKHFIAAEDVANTILAMCSGMLDALSGQIISVDKGNPFVDNLMRLYTHREEYGL
ncbi:MAG: SDR family oxidoreductase [Pseudomonadota bacterium]